MQVSVIMELHFNEFAVYLPKSTVSKGTYLLYQNRVIMSLQCIYLNNKRPFEDCILTNINRGDTIR